MPTEGRGLRLRGRDNDCKSLWTLLSSVQSSSSQVLVLRGEAGVGKTALLDYAVEQSAGFRVAQVAGVESDMELAFAGLQQLCAPLLNRLDELPEPQREALNVAFGRGVGADPRPLPRRAGGAEPDGGRRRRATSAVHHRRRAVARPGVGADTGIRRAAADGRAGRASCSRCETGRRGAGGSAGTRDQRPVGRRRPGACWTQSCWAGSTSGCATASSPRPAAFRWPCSRCRATSPRPSSPADSAPRVGAPRRADRRELRAPHPVAAGADPAVAARRGRRTGR